MSHKMSKFALLTTMLFLVSCINIGLPWVGGGGRSYKHLKGEPRLLADVNMLGDTLFLPGQEIFWNIGHVIYAHKAILAACDLWAFYETNPRSKRIKWYKHNRERIEEALQQIPKGEEQIDILIKGLRDKLKPEDYIAIKWMKVERAYKKQKIGYLISEEEKRLAAMYDEKAVLLSPRLSKPYDSYKTARYYHWSYSTSEAAVRKDPMEYYVKLHKGLLAALNVWQFFNENDNELIYKSLWFREYRYPSNSINPGTEDVLALIPKYEKNLQWTEKIIREYKSDTKKINMVTFNWMKAEQAHTKLNIGYPISEKEKQLAAQYDASITALAPKIEEGQTFWDAFSEYRIARRNFMKDENDFEQMYYKFYHKGAMAALDVWCFFNKHSKETVYKTRWYRWYRYMDGIRNPKLIDIPSLIPLYDDYLAKRRAFVWDTLSEEQKSHIETMDKERAEKKRAVGYKE